VLGDLALDLGFGQLLELHVGTLGLVVDGGLDLTLGLQRRNNVLVLPSDFVGKTTQDAEFTVGLEPEYSESGRDDVPLSLVVRSGNSLVGAVSLHRILTAGDFVRQHSADRFVQNAARSSVMEGAPLGVDQTTLAEILHVLQLVTVETAGDVDSFASDDDDSLSLKELLGDD